MYVVEPFPKGSPWSNDETQESPSAMGRSGRSGKSWPTPGDGTGTPLPWGSNPITVGLSIEPFDAILRTVGAGVGTCADTPFMAAET